MKDRSAAIVVAGGSGTRFGSLKQFVEFFGFPVISWCIHQLVQAVDHIAVVIPPQVLQETDRETVLKTLRSLVDAVELPEPAASYFLKSLDYRYLDDGMITIVSGGVTRSESVRNGLSVLSQDYSVVVVHDAARPLATADLFRRVMGKIDEGYDGATCYLPVTDTVKLLEDDGSLSTLDRQKLIAVQTPQAFAPDVLRAVHSKGEEATDDIALLEKAGAKIALVEGEALNWKITDPDDVLLLEAVLTAKTSSSQSLKRHG
jgi:2-C-methyl-D-erythritol 4-phosphate cytidylyltransferase